MEYISGPNEISDNEYWALIPNDGNVGDYPHLPEHHALNNNCETLATIERRKLELMKTLS